MSIFSEVKERLPMKDVARYYGIMTNRSGFAKCPFHKERTPSMKIYEDHFYCFSCHCGGDIINLTSQLFSLSPLEAAKKLQTGVFYSTTKRTFQNSRFKYRLFHDCLKYYQTPADT